MNLNRAITRRLGPQPNENRAFTTAIHTDAWTLIVFLRQLDDPHIVLEASIADERTAGSILGIQ